MNIRSVKYYLETIRDAIGDIKNRKDLTVRDVTVSNAAHMALMELKKGSRNMDNYRTRHAAYLAFKNLPNRPYWFENDGIKAYIAVDFHEWLWLPVQESPKYPIEWKEIFIEGGSDENDE